jgi:glutamine amidotransferase
LKDNWVTVPTNSTLTIHKQTVMIHPIIDEFYTQDPSSSRNPAFARDKGLVSKIETNSRPIGSPEPVNGQADIDAIRKRLNDIEV